MNGIEREGCPAERGELAVRWISVMRVAVCVIVLSAVFTGEPARADAVFTAYQKIYDMKFEIFAMDALPPAWFVTLDGYVVTQVSTNHWVYGMTTGPGGDIAPTGLAVGSVVPMFVPELSHSAGALPSSGVYATKKFQDVLCSGVNNMGVLDDPLIRTPVAWRSDGADLLVWLGDHWLRVIPSGSQTAGQAIAARYQYIVRALRKNNAAWTWGDTEVLADLARTWGCLWRGHIRSAAMSERWNDSSSSDGPTSFGAGLPGGTPQGGGNWDVGNGNNSGNVPGGTPGGGSGGWDK